jgi:hypothetical protein
MPSEDKASTPTQPLPSPDNNDIRLIRAFVRFAVRPSESTASRVPFAPTIRLGVGDNLSNELDRTDAAQPSAWVLDLASFGGITGPFSALDRIREHAAMANSQTVAVSGGAFDVSLGEHLRCSVSEPISDPAEIVVSRRVSLKPAKGSLTSCLDWFSVDLFLNPAGEVQAVLLDVWEP